MVDTAGSLNLFVYGTLRDDPGHEMFHVLARNAKFVGEATVAGRLYDLGEYPGLVLSSERTDRVKGELYRLSEATAGNTLSVLDDYEGMGPSEPTPHEYRRALVTAYLTDGKSSTAWAYILDRPSTSLPRIMSGDFSEWRSSRRQERSGTA
jgi:pyruvate carboxylase